MLFMFPGEIAVSDLEVEIQPFFEMLRKEGLDRVSGLQISFLGWRGDQRCQIVDKENLISEVVFQRCDSHGPRVPRPGPTIRDRPIDLEHNPFAVMFGHDD